MSEDHPSPFPTALVLDTSFLRTIGGTDSSAYQRSSTTFKLRSESCI
jgi:hypothetical protein